MPTAKSVTGLIIFAKSEASYLAGAALTGSTNAIQTVLDHPVFNISYAYDGNRGGASYSGGSLRRVAKMGRTTQGTVRIEAKGLGSAYSIAATPPNLHPFILASGLSGSFESSGWTYKPFAIGTQPTSMALEVFTRGEKWSASGSYTNMTLNGETFGPVVAEFDTQGVLGDPSELSSPPARTWVANDVLPPNNTNYGFTIGSYTGSAVKSWRYEQGLEISPRMNGNSAVAHGGFVTGRRTTKLMVTVEAPTLTDYQIYESYASSSAANLSLTVGSVQYNRFSLILSGSQLTNVTPSSDGPLATLELEFTPSVTTPDSDDDVTLRFF